MSKKSDLAEAEAAKKAAAAEAERIAAEGDTATDEEKAAAAEAETAAEALLRAAEAEPEDITQTFSEEVKEAFHEAFNKIHLLLGPIGSSVVLSGPVQEIRDIVEALRTKL